MNKKYILVVPALVIGVSSSLLINKLFTGDEVKTSHLRTQSSKVVLEKTKGKVTTFDKKKDDALSKKAVIKPSKKEISLAGAFKNLSSKDLDKIIKHEKVNKKVLTKQIVKALKHSTHCALTKGCLKKEPNTPFFDKNNHPEVYKVERMLSSLNDLTLDSPQLLKDIKVDLLLKTMKIDNNRVFVLSSALLLNKGEKYFDRAMKMGKDFKGGKAASLVELSYKIDSTNGRKQLVEHYLSSSDQNTLATVVERLNYLEASSSDMKSYINTACENIETPEAESSKLIRYNIQKVARKYNLESKCKL